MAVLSRGHWKIGVFRVCRVFAVVNATGGAWMVVVVMHVDHMRTIAIMRAIAIMGVIAIVGVITIMGAIVVRCVASVAMIVMSAVVMAGVAVMMCVVGWAFVLGHVSHYGLGELPRMVAWTSRRMALAFQWVDEQKAQFDTVGFDV